MVETRRPANKRPEKSKKKGNPFFSGIAKTNKWLLVTTVLVVVLSFGLYFWADRYSDTSDAANNVQKVDMVNSEFKDILKEGRVSSDTFYAITQPSWDSLSRETQEQAVEKIFKTYSQKGCKRISLINNKGQAVAFASANKVQVFRQE